MADKSLVFAILAKDNASDKFDKVGRSAEKSGGKMAKLGKVGKMAALGLGAALVGAAGAAFKLAQGAAEDEQAAARMAKTLRNTTGATNRQVASTEDWISKQGKLLGVTDDELRPAIENLARGTGDLGKAQKLAALAMDVSAGSGKSLGQVSEALMKAAKGNVGGLGRLGIATKNAAGETKSFDEITKDLAKTFGGQAKTAAGTTAGQFQRLKVQLAETGESIGAKLLPIAGKLAGWINDKLIPAASKTWALLSSKLGPVFERVGGFIRDKVVPAIRDLVDRFTGANQGTNKFKKALQDAEPAIRLVKTVLSTLGVVIRNVVWPVVKKVAEVALPAFGRALNVVGRVGIWLWNNVFSRVFRLILGGIGGLLVAWGGMLRALGKVPGFGWAKEAGDKMQGAGRKALELRDNIKKIPPAHIDVNTGEIRGAIGLTNELIRRLSIASVAAAGAGGAIGSGRRPPGYARGTNHHPGGWAMVGEQGPELVNLPRGSKVLPHSQSVGAMSGVGGGEWTAEVHIHLDGETIVKSVKARNRRIGVTAAGI